MKNFLLILLGIAIILFSLSGGAWVIISITQLSISFFNIFLLLGTILIAALLTILGVLLIKIGINNL